MLEPIRADMEILENQSYHRRLLMYKGELAPEAVLNPESGDPLELATQGYGVGNWYLYNGQPEKAREVFEQMRRRLPAEFDEGGSIGKRYRRQDEIGTPWGVTIDGQTLEDDTVTLRDRDSLEQTRVPIAALADDLASRLEQPWRSPKLG